LQVMLAVNVFATFAPNPLAAGTVTKVMAVWVL
jgi:hypothetical protein